MSDLVLTQEKLAELLVQYAKWNVLKEPPDVFFTQLMMRNAWFVEVGNVGLVAITNIIPGYCAMFEYFNWDMKLGKERIEPLRGVIARAFHEFALYRLAATIPLRLGAMQRHLTQVGFKQEGLARNGRFLDGKPTDVILMSILPEEAKWYNQ